MNCAPIWTILHTIRYTKKRLF